MGILKSIGILLWRRTFGRKKHQESLKDGNKLKALIDNEIEEGFRLNTKGYAEFKVISDLAHKILWNIGADGLTEDTKDVASINKNSIPKIKSRLSKILKEFPKFKTELKREESLLMKAAKFKEDKEISINSKIAMTELYKILSEVSEIENQFRKLANLNLDELENIGYIKPKNMTIGRKAFRIIVPLKKKINKLANHVALLFKIEKNITGTISVLTKLK
ncbi:hypothetical protein HOC01_02765 [archaeon]|jgi:hypothetical protein|nr:hypothetical protein [archaeon]MBT6697757.1 hypothetical protein [archaeon]